MTRKLSTALVALLAVAAAGTATVAEAATSKTKLSISASTGNGENRFGGFVKSSRDSCHNGRKVYLYKQKGRKRNLKRDKKVGSERATPNQDGSQYNIGTEESGKFYTYVKATRRCKSALSKVVRNVEPEEEEEGEG